MLYVLDIDMSVELILDFFLFCFKKRIFVVMVGRDVTEDMA